MKKKFINNLKTNYKLIDILRDDIFETLIISQNKYYDIKDEVDLWMVHLTIKE